MRLIKKDVVLVVFLIVLVAIMTLPLVFHMNAYVPGFSSSQEIPGALWDNWRTQYSYAHHMDLRRFSLVNYPFGIGLYDAGLMPYLNYFIHNALSIATTPILTYNIQVLLNMLLSALIMYALVYMLTRRRLAGIFSGVAFAFCPYQFARQWQHLSLSFNWVFPLVLITLILLHRHFNRQNVIFFIGSMLLMYSFDFHIMFFGSFMVFMYLVYTLMMRKDSRFIVKLSGLWLMVFILLGSQFLPPIMKIIQGSGKHPAGAYNTVNRKFDDLFTQSARPLSYFMPSTEHPAFGGVTNMFVGSGIWGVGLTEHQLYLGWTVIILSILAFKQWRKKRALPNTQNEQESVFYIGYFVFLAVGAWFMSQPPWWDWGVVKINMPSYYIYKILPMIRAYCRFGIIVMLGCAILAGFGLAFFLDRWTNRSKQIAVGLALIALVLFEFLNFPPFKVINASHAPQVYTWLRDQPDVRAIAEYPLDTAGANFMYQYYQIFHQKPIINGSVPHTYPNRIAQSIANLSEPKTAGVLKWLGVRYVLVHRNDYTASELVEQINELDAISSNAGLRAIDTFPSQDCYPNTLCFSKTGPIDVYEVIAASITPSVEK